MSGSRVRALLSGRVLWLGFGVALLLVANARWIYPLATWFFAVGWLVFLDRSRRLSGLATAVVPYVLAHFVIWWEIIPAPGVLYFLIAATYGVVYFIPFVVHRVLASEDGRLRATLVFPLAWVSIELVFSRWVTPYGSWASLAYTQSEQLALLQLVSVTGIAGVTFLITWFASVAAWTARPSLDTRRRVSAAVVFSVALLLVLVLGQIRLRGEAAGPSVRTAALVPSGPALDALEHLLEPVRRGEPVSVESLQSIGVAAAQLNEDLLERTRREARAGARLIAWSEVAARVFESEEEEFLARASRLAAEEGVYLLLGLGVWHPDGSPPFENKVVAIEATGELAWQYHKAHPVIGGESSFIAAGGGSVRSLDAEFGRIGAVICHDLDFPSLLRQASADRIGLLVGPSADWSVIVTLHARMAVVRAVENGFTLLRPTSNGRSLAVDNRGRFIARLDFAEDAMIAHVPVGSARTVYGMLGDWFAWLCLGVLGLTVIFRLGRTDDSSR